MISLESRVRTGKAQKLLTDLQTWSEIVQKLERMLRETLKPECVQAVLRNSQTCSETFSFGSAQQGSDRKGTFTKD